MRGETDKAIEFLRAWAPQGPWVLTAIKPDQGGTVTATFDPSCEDRARAWIDARNGVENIYFTVNKVLKPLSSKAKKTDIAEMVCLHVDVDPRAGEDLDLERERALRLLRSYDPPPTWIVDSGGGFQGFWTLAEAQTVRGNEARWIELEAYNQQIAVALQADKCHNIDRIMRLPGTVNVPDERKRRKGRRAALARVVEHHPDRVYDLSRFTPAPRVQMPGSMGSGVSPVKISGNLGRLKSVDDLPDTVPQRTKMLIVQGDDPDDPTKYPSRSEALWAVVCSLVRAGCDDDTIAMVLLDPDFGISASVLDKPRPEEYVAYTIRRAREDAINPWLAKLNDKHAVIEDIGGKCRVISEVEDAMLNRPRITRQSFEDFRNRYMHIQVEVGKDKDGKPIQMPLGKWWLSQPARRQYRTIVFAPRREAPDAYNLWRGFACDARPGDCSLYLKHIHDNICSGNEEHYEYLLNWMARAVQFPDRPGEVAVVLRGRMGTGKSMFVRTFGHLWGRHFLQVSNSKHLVGAFNAHLRDCVILFGDEAFYAGDKQHESILKTLVTEDTLIVEGKGVDAETAPNFLHIILASNSQWVVPAGGDERRFFVLDVGDGAKQNNAYFRAIRDQMENGGYEALLHLLMRRDLSNFEVRAFPRTAALSEQKLLSLSPEEDWWHEKLSTGNLLNAVRGGGWPREVLKEALHEDYLEYAQKMRLYKPLSRVALGKFLARMMPAPYPKSVQRWTSVTQIMGDGSEHQTSTRQYFYELPSLEVCRDFWDNNYEGTSEWDVPEAHDDTPF